MIKSKMDGFVLFIVLVFLQLFSLLNVYGLLNMADLHKAHGHLWQREIYLSTAKKILHDLENEFSIHVVSCMIPIMSTIELNKKSISWWQHQACNNTFNDIQYYYVIELLDQNVCRIIKTYHQFAMVNYYRITLLALPQSFKGAKIRLQSTFIKLISEVSSCEAPLFSVTLGHQTQREI